MAPQIGELIHAKVFSAGLPALAVGLGFERNLLTLVEGAQASAFDRADMNEDILPATVRLKEAEALVALNHFTVPVAICNLQDALSAFARTTSVQA